MKQPKPHTLAAEVDRALRLDLSNGRFEILVKIISRQEDGRKFAKDLMVKSPQEVLDMIEVRRENE